MKITTVILIILIILAVCALALFVTICTRFALMVLVPKINSYDQQMEQCLRHKRFTQDYIDTLDKEPIEIRSRYGYIMHGIIEENDISRLPENRTRVAILCHGWTSGKITMSGYARRLLDLGFTCVLYDHRNHGDNDRCVRTSMGYYEKYDLQTVIDYCYERFGSDIRLITLGESMGAATVLSLLEIDDRPALTIADCGFSNLYELCRHLVVDFFHIPRYKAIIWFSDILLRVFGHFSLKKVNPIDGVRKAACPILFCHGLSDSFIPCTMSEDMSKVGPGVRELYLCPGAEHALSEITEPEEYTARLTDFINRNYR